MESILILKIGFKRFTLVPQEKYQILIKNKKISFRKSLIMNLPDKLFDMPKENNLLVGLYEN